MEKILDTTSPQEAFDVIAKLGKRNENNKEKGDILEFLGVALLRIHPVFSKDYDTVWLYEEIPEDIRISFTLPENEKGLDGLAKTKEGKFVGLQMKFRSLTEAIIPWGELGTFTGSLFDRFEKGVFITNQFNVCEELKNKRSIISITNSCWKKYCSGPIWKNILEEYSQYVPERTMPRTPIYYPLKKPRKNQEKAVLNVKQKTDATTGKITGQIVMATGTGKTMTSLFITEELNSKKVLVVVPSLMLLSQYYYAMVKRFISRGFTANDIPEVLLIGSKAIKDKDLCEYSAFDITTDYNVVKQFFDDKEKYWVFCTYQSGPTLIKGMNKRVNLFDITFFDEAHNTAGNKNKKFQKLLSRDISLGHRIFQTATPKYYQGRNDEEFKGMNDVSVYGEEIYSYSVRKAIDEGVLCPYKVIIPVGDENIIREIHLNKVVDKETDYQTLTAAYCLVNVILKYKDTDRACKKILTYHSYVKEANNFVKVFKRVIDYLKIDLVINHQTISGATNAKKKTKIMNRFRKNKDEICILSSAKVLNEGVDIPEVDTEVFVRPSRSKINIMQRIGRSLRVLEGKLLSKIILPVCFEPNEDDEDVGAVESKESEDEDETKAEGWENIFDILKVLVEEDELVYEYFQEKSMSEYRTPSSEREENEIIEVIDFEERLDIANKILSTVETKIVEFKFNNYKKLEEVLQFRINKGRFPRESSKNKDETRKGTWLTRKRRDKRNGKLDKDLEKKIEEVLGGFEDWYWGKVTKYNSEFERLTKKMFPKWAKSTSRIARFMQDLDPEKKYSLNELKAYAEIKSMKNFKITQFLNIKTGTNGFGTILMKTGDNYTLIPELVVEFKKHFNYTE